MEEFVGSAEIGRLFDVSSQRVHQLTTREDFPEPVAVLRMGKVWRAEDVRMWAKATGRTLSGDD